LFKRRKPEDLPGATPTPADTTGADEALLDGGMTAPDSTNIPPRRPDAGFGVPPFRPADKEAPAMGRSPFPAPPAPPSGQPAPGMSGMGSSGMSGPGGAGMPGAAARPGVPPGRGREPAERRTLVVGRGISVQGVVTDAERLVVEGTVEATMIHATELMIAQGGVFKGEVEVEDTEIAGTIDGTLTARGNLVVRATGKVLGTARCRRLQVEDGGQITGQIQMITDNRTDTPRPAPEVPPAA
jgi:cytoskeletal protein CcmA (bactofilin family)